MCVYMHLCMCVHELCTGAIWCVCFMHILCVWSMFTCVHVFGHAHFIRVHVVVFVVGVCMCGLIACIHVQCVWHMWAWVRVGCVYTCACMCVVYECVVYICLCINVCGVWGCVVWHMWCGCMCIHVHFRVQVFLYICTYIWCGYGTPPPKVDTSHRICTCIYRRPATSNPVPSPWRLQCRAGQLRGARFLSLMHILGWDPGRARGQPRRKALWHLWLKNLELTSAVDQQPLDALHPPQPM
jgi:hypothetical protein